MEIYKKMPDPNPGDIVSCEPTQWKRTRASLRSGNAHGHLRRAILCGSLQEKCRTNPGDIVSCEPAQWKRKWKFAGKMPDPKATKVKACPVSATLRSFVACSAAASKATFGWITRAPAKKAVKKLKTKLRRAGFDHKMASPHLVNLVLGHCQDVRFCAGVNAILAVLRQTMRTGHEFKDWAHSEGPAQRIRSFLKDLDWREMDEWVWKHETLDKFLVLQKSHSRFIDCVDLVAHNLRESYLGSGRHEAAELNNEPYSEGLLVCKPKAAMLYRSGSCVVPWFFQPLQLKYRRFSPKSAHGVTIQGFSSTSVGSAHIVHERPPIRSQR